MLARMTGQIGATLGLLVGVSVLVFALVRVVPGDPVQIMLGNRASAASMAQLRRELGFDDPLVVQYWRFARGLLHGDLGTSIWTGRPVAAEIAERLPDTLQLTVAALTLATVLGIGCGIVAALSRNTLVIAAIQVIILAGMAMPAFWTGLLLMLTFALGLGWFPVIDDGSLRALILPTIALALPSAAYLARLVRGGMVEVIRQDYMRTGRAKGLRPTLLIVRHALPNVLLPIVTVLGLQFGALLTGAVVIEIVFARPGLGRFAMRAIEARDYPQIQGIVLVIALLFVIVNLLVDLTYGWIDPRTRYESHAVDR